MTPPDGSRFEVERLEDVAAVMFLYCDGQRWMMPRRKWGSLQGQPLTGHRVALDDVAGSLQAGDAAAVEGRSGCPAPDVGRGRAGRVEGLEDVTGSGRARAVGQGRPPGRKWSPGRGRAPPAAA
jgi:hypothetical protein